MIYRVKHHIKCQVEQTHMPVDEHPLLHNSPIARGHIHAVVSMQL